MSYEYNDGIELHKRRVAYHNTLDMELQQTDARIWALCDSHDLDAEGLSFDDVAETSMTKMTTKFQKTPHMDMGHARRWLKSSNYFWSTKMDTFDKSTALTRVDSSYIKSAKAAANRTKDDVCLDAMFANVKTGMDAAGDDDDIEFPASQIVHVRAGSANWDPANPGATGSDVGLNAKKLKMVKGLFMRNEAPEDEQINIAINADAFEDLLDDDEIKNKDFFLGEFNEKGKVSALGYNFVHSERVKKSGGNILLPAWQKSGVARAITSELVTDLGKRRDLSNAWQASAEMSVGGFRRREGQVAQIVIKQ